MPSETDAKLFGMTWNTDLDTYASPKLELNSDAKTKRQILSSLNGNFYPLGINIPLLNRTKLFVRDLLCRKDLSSDTVLSVGDWKTYRKIA